MSDMIISRDEIEKAIGKNLEQIIKQTVSDAMSSGVEEGIKDAKLSPSAEKGIENTLESIGDVVESTMKKTNKELKSMLTDSFNQLLSDLAKNKVSPKTQSDFAASFSASLLKGLDVSEVQARLFGELSSISDRMVSISEQIQNEIVNGVSRTSNKLINNISLLEDLRDIGSQAVENVKFGVEESTKKTRKRSFSISELFDFSEDELINRINTLFEKAADGSTEQIKNLISSVKVALARGIDVSDEVQLAIGGPKLGDPYVKDNVDKSIEKFKEQVDSEIEKFINPVEKQEKKQKRSIQATKEYLLELKEAYSIWDSMNDKEQDGGILSPEEEQQFEKAKESIREFNEAFEELVVTLKDGEKVSINDYFDDWDKISKKNIKSVEGIGHKTEIDILYENYEKLYSLLSQKRNLSNSGLEESKEELESINKEIDSIIESSPKLERFLNKSSRTSKEQFYKLFGGDSNNIADNIQNVIVEIEKAKKKYRDFTKGIKWEDFVINNTELQKDDFNYGKSSIERLENALEIITPLSDEAEKSLENLLDIIKFYNDDSFLDKKNVISDIKKYLEEGNVDFAAILYDKYKKQGGKISAEKISQDFADNFESYLLDALKKISINYDELMKKPETFAAYFSKDNLEGVKKKQQTYDAAMKSKYEQAKVYVEGLLEFINLKNKLFSDNSNVNEESSYIKINELIEKRNSLLEEQSQIKQKIENLEEEYEQSLSDNDEDEEYEKYDSLLTDLINDLDNNKESLIKINIEASSLLSNINNIDDEKLKSLPEPFQKLYENLKNIAGYKDSAKILFDLLDSLMTPRMFEFDSFKAVAEDMGIVQKTIESYNELKQIIKEMEEIYAKIEQGSIEKRFGDYKDLKTNSNLIDTSGYDETDYSTKNMDYLKNKIKETYSVYKKLESAIKNTGGFFRGDRYDSYELEKLKNIFGYFVQEYYDFQRRFQLDGLLETEEIENVDNIVSNMTKEFKDFVSEIKNNSDSVAENNKLYKEEQERLDESNKSLVERYNILRKLVVSKLVSSGVDEDTRYFLQDIIPFFSDISEDFSSLQVFGTKLFNDDIKYNVLEEIAKALGFINEQLVEYKKNIKGFEIKKVSLKNNSPRLKIAQEKNNEKDDIAIKKKITSFNPSADYEDFSSAFVLDEDKILESAKATEELQRSAKETAKSVDEENQKLEETSEKAEKAAKGKKKTSKANEELAEKAKKTTSELGSENEELKKLQEQKKQDIINKNIDDENKVLRQIDYSDGSWEFIQKLEDGQTRSMFYKWNEELQDYILSVGNVDTVFERLEKQILRLDKEASNLKNKITRNSKNPTYDPTSDQNKRNQAIAEANRLYKILNDEYSENIAYEYKIEKFEQERIENQRKLNELSQSPESTQNFGAAKNYENLGKQLSKYYELAIKYATNSESMTVDEIQLYDKLTQSINRAILAQEEFSSAKNNNGDIVGSEKSQHAYKFASEKLINELKEGYLKSYILEIQEDFNKMISKINSSSRLFKFSDSLKTELKNVEERIKDLMKSFGGDESTTNLINLGKEIDSIRNKIQELDVTARNSNGIQASAEDINNKLKSIEQHLHNDSAMSKELKEEFKKLSDEYVILLASKEPQSAVEKLNIRFKELEVQLERSGKKGKSMLDRMTSSLKTANAQLLSMYLSWMDIIRYGRQLINAVVDIDTSITELRKVSDASDIQLSHALKTATKDAKELGSAISDVVQIQSDWARLGYTVEESEQLARITTLFKSIGDNMDAESASQYMVSTLQGFQKNADEALDIVDKYNEVANNFAIDTSGIGEALQKSAASFNAANTDLSKSIALITATNEVVQNPSTVGTLWKTMSARIRGAKTELEELGEEEDEFTQTTSRLRDLVKGLTGFDIMEDEETFKDIYEIILGIGNAWDDLTDIEQASLGEALAGKRSANALYAVLGNLDTLQAAYETAENSAGSAMREQENYTKSIQYSLDRLTASSQEWANNFISSDAVKFFVDLGNAFVSFTSKSPIATITALSSAILSLQKNIGLFGTNDKNQFTIFGKSLEDRQLEKLNADLATNTALTEKNMTAIASRTMLEKYAVQAEAQEAMANLKLATGEETLTKTRLEEIVANYELKVSRGELISSAEAENVANAQLILSNSKIATTSGIAAVATKGLAAAMNMLVQTAIITFLIYVAKKLYENSKEAENCAKKISELNQEFKSLTSTYKSHKSSVEDIIDEYQELSQGVGNVGENIRLSIDDFKRFNNISNQIGDMFPELISGWTSEGNAILSVKDNVELLTDALEKERIAANNLKIQNFDSYSKNWKNNFETNGNAKLFDFGLADVGGQISKQEAIDILNSIQDLSVEEYKFYQELGKNWFKTNKAIESEYGKTGLELARGTYLFNIFGIDGKVSNEEFKAAQVKAKALAETYMTEMESDLSEMQGVAYAYLDNTDEYTNSENVIIKNIASSLVSNLSKDILEQTNAEPVKIIKWVDNIVQTLFSGENSDKIQDSLTQLFSLQQSELPLDDAIEKVNTYLDSIKQYFSDDDYNILLNILGLDNNNSIFAVRDRLNSSIKSIAKDEKELARLESYTNGFTKDQADLWLEVTNGCNNASVAIQKHKKATAEQIKESQKLSKTLFAEADAFSKIKSGIEGVYDALNTLRDPSATALEKLEALMNIQSTYDEMQQEITGNSDATYELDWEKILNVDGAEQALERLQPHNLTTIDDIEPALADSIDGFVASANDYAEDVYEFVNVITDSLTDTLPNALKEAQTDFDDVDFSNKNVQVDFSVEDYMSEIASQNEMLDYENSVQETITLELENQNQILDEIIEKENQLSSIAEKNEMLNHDGTDLSANDYADDIYEFSNILSNSFKKVLPNALKEAQTDFDDVDFSNENVLVSIDKENNQKIIESVVNMTDDVSNIVSSILPIKVNEAKESIDEVVDYAEEVSFSNRNVLVESEEIASSLEESIGANSGIISGTATSILDKIKNAVPKKVNTKTQIDIEPDIKLTDIDEKIETSINQSSTNISQIIHDILVSNAEIGNYNLDDIFNQIADELDVVNNSFLSFLDKLKDGTEANDQMIESFKNLIIQEQRYSSEMNHINTTIDGVQDAYKTLSSGIKEYNEKGYVTLDTMQSILELDTDYISCLIDENGKLQINKESYKQLVQAKLDDAKVTVVNKLYQELLDLAQQDVKDSADNAEESISDYSNTCKTEVPQGVQKAIASNTALAASFDIVNQVANGVDLAGAMESALSKSEGNAEKIANLFSDAATQLQFIDAAGDGLLKNFDDTMGVSDSSSSAKDTIGDLMDYYDKALDAGWISFQEYTSAVTKALDDAYASGKISAAEYFQYVEQMLRKQIEIFERVIDAVTARLDREISIIQNKISDIELQNNALNKQKEEYDAVIQAIQDALDEEIDALEKEKEGIQDKIDALQDEQDAYDFLYKKEQALYELERAQSQRTKKVFTENGYVYQVDQKAVKDARKNLNDIKTEEIIRGLEDEIKAIDETIEKLQDMKEEWSKISEMFTKKKNAGIAAAMFGENWRQDLLDGKISLENFASSYVAIEEQIYNNDKLIESFNEQIEYYERIKDEWSEITSRYEEERNKLYAAQLLGADWEEKLLNGRLNVVEDFTNQYIKLNQMADEAAASNSLATAFESFGKGIEGAEGKLDEFMLKFNNMKTEWTGLAFNETGKNVVSKMLGENWESDLDNSVSKIQTSSEKTVVANEKSQKSYEDVSTSVKDTTTATDGMTESTSKATKAIEDEAVALGSVISLGTDFSTFEQTYSSVMNEFCDNTQLKESYDEKMEIYEELKLAWADLTTVFATEKDNQMEIEAQSEEYEVQMLNERQDNLELFNQNFKSLMQTQVNICLEAANKIADIMIALEASNWGAIKGIDGQLNTELFKAEDLISTAIALLEEYRGVIEEAISDIYSGGYGKAKAGTDTGGYKGGTKSAEPGYHLVAENGKEIILDNYGNAFIVPKQTMLPFEGGEMVLNNADTNKIISASKSVQPLSSVLSAQKIDGGLSSALSSFGKSKNNFGQLSSAGSTQNIKVDIGDIVLHNVQNVDTLSNEIVKKLPGKLMQKLKS